VKRLQFCNSYLVTNYQDISKKNMCITPKSFSLVKEFYTRSQTGNQMRIKLASFLIASISNLAGREKYDPDGGRRHCQATGVLRRCLNFYIKQIKFNKTAHFLSAVVKAFCLYIFKTKYEYVI